MGEYIVGCVLHSPRQLCLISIGKFAQDDDLRKQFDCFEVLELQKYLLRHIERPAFLASHQLVFTLNAVMAIKQKGSSGHYS